MLLHGSKLITRALNSFEKIKIKKSYNHKEAKKRNLTMCSNEKKTEYNWQAELMFPKIFKLPFLHLLQFYVQK